MHSNYTCTEGCPVEATLVLIGGKWMGVVLVNLMKRTKRFNELRRQLPDCSQRMVTKQLRKLEGAGFVSLGLFVSISL